MAALHHHHHHHSHQIKAPAPTWLIKAQDAKKGKADGGDGALPASPRITCMGQVKGRPRRCSGARRGDRPAARAGSSGLLERLTLGLFGRRRRGRTSSRACSKVRDVPTCSSAQSRGKIYCGRGGAAAVCTLDPPLPVVIRRPAADDEAPTLWERRRGGGGKALETLRLTVALGNRSPPVSILTEEAKDKEATDDFSRRLRMRMIIS
uniref:Uncharacterized protein n=1 Tax=Oryza barthii TaxID=65489 RepID=A0A0D3FMY0_9ORYZ